MSDPRMPDPRDDRNLDRAYRSENSTGMWAGIALAAFVIVMGLFFLMPRGTDTVATNAPGTSTTRTAPQATPPASPGGSGTASTPSTTGTAPAR